MWCCGCLKTLSLNSHEEERVGSERQGEGKKWGRKKRGLVVMCGGGHESAASRVIYLPNQDTMSRL